MKAHNHYEAAFEDLLRTRQTPYVAVDEAKRAAFRDAKLKSFDFIVYSAHNVNWLVDVKGRRWIGGARRSSWENWVTQNDLDSLAQWEEVFGVGFRALLVFAYLIHGDGAPPAELTHTFRDERYVFAALPMSEYIGHAKLRSPKWNTVNLSTAEFAARVRPLRDWL